MVAILAASPDLETLRLGGYEPTLTTGLLRDLPHETPAPTMYPVLTSLHLHSFLSAQSAAFIISLIKAPGLLDLTIEGWECDDYEDILASLGKSFPSVKILRLTRIWWPFTFDAHRALFSDMPLVEHLIVDSPYSLYALDPLRDPISHTVPLIALKTLQLYDLHPHRTYFEMVKHRKALGSPLKRILIERMGSDPSRWFSGLQGEVEHIEYFDERRHVE